jgi:hypothetical protein
MSDTSIDITMEAALLTALMEASDEEALRLLGQQLGADPQVLRAARGVVAVVLRTLEGDEEAGELLLRAAATMQNVAQAASDEGETARPPATTPPSAPVVASLSVAALEKNADELVRATVEVGSRSMPVAEYAVLCAACGAFPARRKEWHARFGVADGDARRQLDDAWEERFTREPALRELWDLLLRRFRAWLVQYGAV